MKVELYAVKLAREWQVFWSLAPQVDRAYWLQPAFRDEAHRAAAEIQEASGNEGMGTVLWELANRHVLNQPRHGEFIIWPSLLPLGQVERIRKYWPGSIGNTTAANEIRNHLASLIRESSIDKQIMVPGLEGAAYDVPDFAAQLPAARELARQACRAAGLLRGRLLLAGEACALLADEEGFAAPHKEEAQVTWSTAAPALQLASLLGLLNLGNAVSGQQVHAGKGRRVRFPWKAGELLQCQRCGSTAARLRRTACAACGQDCAYCEACLTMGRSRECSLLVSGLPEQAVRAADVPQMMPAPANGTQPQRHTSDSRLARWNLSPAQGAATAAALNYMDGSDADRSITWLQRLAGYFTGTDSSEHQRRFLLWAVTGAGKTEMIFPLIEACLQSGGRALIATPRRDVVLELDPRLRRAFPEAAIVTLYGGSMQRWEYGELTIATTHQLFRFRHAFDLVVIDELDAFPYHNDPMLHFAAERVCKPGGTTVMLSATPPAALQRAARFGRLTHVRVPVRFHRHPLPVPKLIQIPPVKMMLRQRNLPQRLLSALRTSIARGAQVFVFVQQIRDVLPLVGRLRPLFPGIAIDGTSSKDGERAEKVLHFRDRSIRMLVTTTILERGVTVAKSDVFILDADGRLFDAASLVQMAGRAGRSKDDPAGSVYFCASARTRPQLSAIGQIRSMNRIARRKGYLLATGKE
ncbi:DEAD/DEAH box helicase [Paenibacillus nasutitermitis]|uniref:Competence protein ComFA n=1 Tax=Paenibacillus nasutitermitis TaxID=1652958 RepID=A0A917E1K0_9BACL|nr:helicase-related protein [Paenibacillus nasutitermitis]GGD92300.1 hypothetical protein GCM10010911_58680 [Paenibacillus nasutitermitis]